LQFELGKIVLREALQFAATPSSAALPASSCFSRRAQRCSVWFFSASSSSRMRWKASCTALSFCANCGEVM